MLVFACCDFRLLAMDEAAVSAGCRMLLRYPVAKKSIRKHAIRSALREDLVCYTLGLEHVRRYKGLPYLPTLLPSKEEIRGSHLPQQKYHRSAADQTTVLLPHPQLPCLVHRHLHKSNS